MRSQYGISRRPASFQHEPLAVPVEQRRVERRFEQAQPRGDVRLRAAEPFGRAQRAAFLNDGPEGFEQRDVHITFSCY